MHQHGIILHRVLLSSVRNKKMPLDRGIRKKPKCNDTLFGSQYFPPVLIHLVGEDRGSGNSHG